MVDSRLTEEVPQFVKPTIARAEDDMLSVVARIVPTRDIAGRRRRTGECSQVATAHGGNVGPGQLKQMAVLSSIDDAVRVLSRREPSERVACSKRRSRRARQIVLPQRNVRAPIKASDVPISAAEGHNIGGAHGVIIWPRVACRRDGLRLIGQVSVAYPALPLPPQLMQVPIS